MEVPKDENGQRGETYTKVQKKGRKIQRKEQKKKRLGRSFTKKHIREDRQRVIIKVRWREIEREKRTDRQRRKHKFKRRQVKE